ncbi:MAG: ATP-dependent protease subunit HslV [candidate division WOR-3 bacterium]|nr:ATP-dependent protease subunit HslV [candidate division WOR-3 bacterium]
MTINSTTILGVRKDGKTAIGGDGQVTLDKTVIKHSANKIRRLYNNKLLAGFAGSVADAITLFDKFEKYIEKDKGDLLRASIDLTKEWRQDKFLRRLEAMLIVMDSEHSLIISGNGDVIEPDDGVVSIGSGSPYAYAASRALIKHSELTAEDIVKESLSIVADICIYTNNRIILETL